MSQFLSWMQPRDYRVAKPIVTSFTVLAVLVSVVFLPLQPQVQPTNTRLLALAGAALAVGVIMGAAGTVVDGAVRPAWALCPFLAIAAITVIDLATEDASFTAQIFFVFPVLYAGSQLPRRGAALVTAAAVVGDAVAVLVGLPLHEALSDTGYMAAALGATAVMLVRGAEAREASMAQLAIRATTDSLTGLVTRRAFDEATATAMTPPAPEEGTSLILFDLDRFKSVNDRFGHQSGDEVLVQVSALLLESARHGDVVCRLGGDELAILMPRCPIEVANRRASEIVDRVGEQGFKLSAGPVVQISVSAGLAHSPTHADDYPGLYAAADRALYAAKDSGRNRVEALPSMA
ncbi:MAG: GGDEF domain-containing protein [Nocardioides sp.]